MEKEEARSAIAAAVVVVVLLSRCDYLFKGAAAVGH